MLISSRKPSYWINTLICFLFMFGFGHIRPLFGLTELGMALIGVLLGVVYGWITLEIAWPSLAGFLALTAWGYDSINNILKMAFGNHTVIMVLFMLVLTMYMERCGCMDSMTKWFISRKVIVGRPYLVLVFFYVLSAILSLAASNIAALLFLMTVAVSFCERLGYTKKSSYPIALFFVIYLGTQCGLVVIPIEPVILMFLSLIESVTDVPVNIMSWMTFWGILYTVVLLIWLLVVRFIMRPDVSPFQNMTEDDFAEYRQVKFPPEVKLGFAALGLMVFLMTAPTFLPESWALTAFCQKIDVMGSLMLIFVLLSILPQNEKARFNFHIVANTDKINWNLILMVAFALTIAPALSSDVTGFNQSISDHLVPLMTSFSPTLLILVFCTILHLLTNVLNNSTMIAIFINPMAAIAHALGMNPFFTIVIAIAAMCDGLMTPAGTASAPILMGHDWMDMKQYYRHAIVIFGAFEIFIAICAFLLF